MKFWPDAFIGSAIILPFFLLANVNPNAFTWGLCLIVALATVHWFSSKKSK